MKKFKKKFSEFLDYIKKAIFVDGVV